VDTIELQKRENDRKKEYKKNLYFLQVFFLSFCLFSCHFVFFPVILSFLKG